MIFHAALFDPAQIYLEISTVVQTQAWQQSQAIAAPSSRWQAYLNQICLNTVLPWLQEEYTPSAKAWPQQRSLANIWAVVNGTAVTVDVTRFVLIPTETLDLSELRVPKEWIDLPSWAGNYYLGAQVNIDEGYVRLWGYTTHQHLKQEGQYDANDHSYSLSETQVIADLSALAVARQLCPDELTQAAIAPLSPLASTQANNLIQRLGNPDLLIPRLAVPFELWGALLEHGGWRQRLYEQRQGMPEQRSVWQWLQSGMTNLAQQTGWERVEFQPGLVGARGTEAGQPEVLLARQLAIAGQPYELRVLPQGAPAENIWRFELRHGAGEQIPGGFKLRLLTEDLQPFDNNEDVAIAATEVLYIEVALAPGEGIVWETEPLSENYDREILRF